MYRTNGFQVDKRDKTLVLKRRLDLRTGTPVWQSYRAPRVAAARLTRDVTADVLVVGMGISGAMIAESLAATGMSVIAIDRRGPLKGSTAATTALVAFEIDQPLSKLVGKIGRDGAERAWQRSRLAIDSLNAKIAELSIACDLVERPSLYLAGSTLNPGDLCEEAEQRRRIGLWSVYLTPGELRERYGIDRNGALLSRGNLALDPLKLAAGLFRAAAARGARFYAPVEATSFERVGERIAAATKDGPAITAGAVILATGYELMDLVPSNGHRIVSTWAVATRPQPRVLWPEQAFLWEASDPYLYLRTTSDGRVVCGGEDEDFQDEEARDALMAAKARKIAAKLGRLLPRIDAEPEFIWAGSFGTTGTGLPIIGRLPRMGEIHAVLGYGGNGIAWSQIASEITRSSLTGKDDRDARLFAFPDRG